MRNTILICLLFAIGFTAQAQKIAAASDGFFRDGTSVVLLDVDSVSAQYTFENVLSKDEIPAYFTLKDADGNSESVYPENILKITILRDTSSQMSAEDLLRLEGEEDETDGSAYDNDLKVRLTTAITDTLIYERVEIDYRMGEPDRKAKRHKTQLLQLVSNPNHYVKLYAVPNKEDGGTEVAPLGNLISGLERNRKDKVLYEDAYYVRLGDGKAFRITPDTYPTWASVMYADSRVFRKKYSIKKGSPLEQTKKRKKTSRSKVGKKKKKASSLRWDQLGRHLEEFQKAYVVEKAEKDAKRAARKAKKKSRKKRK